MSRGNQYSLKPVSKTTSKYIYFKWIEQISTKNVNHNSKILSFPDIKFEDPFPSTKSTNNFIGEAGNDVSI